MRNSTIYEKILRFREGSCFKPFNSYPVEYFIKSNVDQGAIHRYSAADDPCRYNSYHSIEHQPPYRKAGVVGCNKERNVYLSGQLGLSVRTLRSICPDS